MEQSHLTSDAINHANRFGTCSHAGISSIIQILAVHEETSKPRCFP